MNFLEIVIHSLIVEDQIVQTIQLNKTALMSFRKAYQSQVHRQHMSSFVDFKRF